jgi:hypothetical protein
MMNETSSNDIFRFIQLRPTLPVDETPTISLAEDTPLARELQAAADSGRRTALANAFLKDGTQMVRALKDLPLGPEIAGATRNLKQNQGATLDDLLLQVPSLKDLARERGFPERSKALSDTLLATFHATQGFPKDLIALQDIYRVYDLFKKRRAPDGGDQLMLGEYLKRAILAPSVRRQPVAAPAPLGRVVPAPVSPQNNEVHDLALAMQELAALDRPEHLVKPGKDGLPTERSSLPFTLKAAARQRISKGTNVVLKARGIDLENIAIDNAVDQVSTDLQAAVGNVLIWPRPVVTPEPGITLPPAPAHALVRPAGVADLLVVKQQIKRFEAAEIAHVENVLIGEKKSRAHRQLERSEETYSTDNESTRERETELQTSDRFELNRETSKTVQQDQKYGLGLSLSGKYGPTVEFSSNFNMDISTSTEESSKSSSRYARDVVNRSLERITERVREQRSRTTIKETEETNLHELNNITGSHVRGVYQFIDKVYEAQVFNYGKRQMFDFMVPEPASFLWHVEQHPSVKVDLPPPPDKLELLVNDASEIQEWPTWQRPWSFREIAARFGATDVEAPPPLYKLLTAGVEHGADNAPEGGRPRSVKRVELQLPAGYRPLRARVQAVALTDENPVIAVIIGNQRVVWEPAGGDRTALGDGDSLAHRPQLYLDLQQDSFEVTTESKLNVSVIAWESNTYSVHATIVVRRTAEELDRWRLATYKKIRTAYEDRLREYQNKVEELTNEAEARAERDNERPFGAPPAENTRTINTELKKHCISIITQQRYDAFDATKPGTPAGQNPPYFDFQEAAAEGAYIRFFEQAFEWDQMQYVFYPYFWSRKSTWIDRFVKQDSDPRFAEFLKAGSARVVLPVRPGFEVAITHFIETGKIWGGEGEPPQINSPLYVAIVDEIRERTGAPKGEVAVGEPWDVRVPTALAIIRDRADLPAWERTAPDQWNWKPVGAIQP